MRRESKEEMIVLTLPAEIAEQVRKITGKYGKDALVKVLDLGIRDFAIDKIVAMIRRGATIMAAAREHGLSLATVLAEFERRALQVQKGRLIVKGMRAAIISKRTMDEIFAEIPLERQYKLGLKLGLTPRILFMNSARKDTRDPSTWKELLEYLMSEGWGYIELTVDEENKVTLTMIDPFLPPDVSWGYLERAMGIKFDMVYRDDCGKKFVLKSRVPIGMEYRRKDVEWYPKVDYEKCISCGKCVESCPIGILSMELGPTRIEVENPDECLIGCRACEEVCEKKAIKLSRKW